MISLKRIPTKLEREEVSMKNVRLVVLLVFAVSVAVALYGAEKATTFEGTLVDSKCYLKDNSLTGNDHGTVKECGTMCAKGGTPAGLLTKTKKFHAVLAPSPALAPFIGQTVRINGSLHNGAILAEKGAVDANGLTYEWRDRKSTRLNSSHGYISYAVFCLKKKK